MADPLEEVRRICLALPETNERLSHGAPCFFVRQKRPLCYYHDNHRGDGRVSVWFPAEPGLQDLLVDPDGGPFFRPAASASGTFRNWVGMYIDGLDHEVDWQQLRTLIEAAYRTIAPRGLVAHLDDDQ